MLKKILLSLLGLVVLAGVGIASVLNYLSPEEVAPPVASADTRRSVTGGEIIGYNNGQGALVWRGIPYAAAPTGANRWRAPQPVKPWQGDKEVIADGAECATWGSMFNPGSSGVYGQEDCLYLNVFAPEGSTEALPVMFWIHGGANKFGSGGGSLYDGTALATRHQVILVSINYRLFGLGWFNHPALATGNPEDDSGNYGTLDQIAALRWVHDNIEQFGGDPDRVTVFGESAGGWNTLAMMASPLAEGLFHRAIVQSGGLDIEPLSVARNFTDDEAPGHPFSSAEVVSQILIEQGKASDKTEARELQAQMPATELASFLRSLNAEQFYAAYAALQTDQALLFPDLFGDGHVLPAAQPSQVLFSNTDNYNAVPVILGTNNEEMKLFMAFNPELVKFFMNLPVGFHDLEEYNRINRYSTDNWKVTGVDRLASAMRGAQGDSVFAYRFDARDLRDFGLIDLKDLLGAAHAMEIPYVFGNFPNSAKAIFPESLTPGRDRLSHSMMSYWSEFAYSGNPGAGRDGSELPWTTWQNGAADQTRLMILDSDNGEGLRMSTEELRMADLKQRFFSDDNFDSQEARCEGYKMLFQGDDFVEEEYSTLGESGCS